MKKFLFWVILWMACMYNIFQIQLGFMWLKSPESVRILFGCPTETGATKKQPKLICGTVKKDPGLPRVQCETVSLEEEMIRVAGIREEAEELALCEEYGKLPLVVRKPGDERIRPDYPVDISVISRWLDNPLLMVSGSTSGESERVQKAKAHLRNLFKTGDLRNPFSKEEIISIMLAEAIWIKAQEGEYIVNLNTLGDRGYSDPEQWAHGPFQISKRMHESVSVIQGFGLKSTDFLGDLELSLYVYIAWHQQWSKDAIFSKRMAIYNAGPTGSKPGHKFYSKGVRYAAKVNRFLEVVQKKEHMSQMGLSQVDGGEPFKLPSREK